MIERIDWDQTICDYVITLINGNRISLSRLNLSDIDSLLDNIHLQVEHVIVNSSTDYPTRALLILHTSYQLPSSKKM